MKKMKKGVENFKRRTWDAEEYSRLAIEREDQERTGKKRPIDSTDGDEPTVETDFGKFNYADASAAGPMGSSKAYLDVERARGGQLDLDGRIGTKQKVDGGARQAGYHCTVCDRVFQDSNALLDHVNSREHQSRLGFSMYVATSSHKDVKKKLNEHVERATHEDAEKAFQKQEESDRPDTLEERVKKTALELKKEQEAKRAERKAKKKQKRMDADDTEASEQVETEAPDTDLMAAMGFSSFGGS